MNYKSALAGLVKINIITELKTYNLGNIKENLNFFTNELLVHNKS